MIITVGNIKGGVGKTTLAINLAIARAAIGRRVLLVDTDKQATASTFTDIRTERRGSLGPGYTAIQLFGSAIHTQIRQMAGNYDDILIDVGGTDSGNLRSSLLVCSLILIPVQPRAFDVWGARHTAELIGEARGFNEALRALVVINAADPAHSRENREASDLAASFPGIDVSPAQIVRRKAWPIAADQGLSVLEYSDRKASHDFLEFVSDMNRYAGDIQ